MFPGSTIALPATALWQGEAPPYDSLPAAVRLFGTEKAFPDSTPPSHAWFDGIRRRTANVTDADISFFRVTGNDLTTALAPTTKDEWMKALGLVDDMVQRVCNDKSTAHRCRYERNFGREREAAPPYAPSVYPPCTLHSPSIHLRPSHWDQ